MLIIDAHLDLGWNALQWNRNLELSTSTLRMLEVGIVGPGRAMGTTALPELRRGRVALCFATLLARSTGRPEAYIDYGSAAQAYGVARGQLAYYQALEKTGHVRIIYERAALDAHMQEWQAWDADQQSDGAKQPPLGLIISMESADPILEADELGEWQAAGVRLIGPAHYGPGRYAGGTGTELPLTPLGRKLLSEMKRYNVILDATHLSDQAFWEAARLYDGPMIASHNSCRSLVPHQRQFDDEQLKLIIERDGVIGMPLDLIMLQFGWIRGGRHNPPVSLHQVVDHIDHICQLAGNSKHVGIGSDLDGGFGREQSPQDLDTIADLQLLRSLLTQRGYAEADCAAILHGNWLRLLRHVWGE
ncbi:dipeptidase [Dictyobacter aurantiacus]|uniref:Peptidase n=1 Tax=Dictyobacter aurantiacus TaxID=1936993 RepID=A0A401Z7W9_9CHLR|nr:membrane dipeptidase [Dictyobacter aurantiacus]GCE02929.1 peptidase [Dictyobacter aurantiacus]